MINHKVVGIVDFDKIYFCDCVPTVPISYPVLPLSPSRKEVLSDAIRALLESKPSLKIEIAIDLYRRGKVNLWRASEIAGMSLEEFKEVLASRGIKITVGGAVEESPTSSPTYILPVLIL